MTCDGWRGRLAELAKASDRPEVLAMLRANQLGSTPDSAIAVLSDSLMASGDPWGLWLAGIQAPAVRKAVALEVQDAEAWAILGDLLRTAAGQWGVKVLDGESADGLASRIRGAANLGAPAEVLTPLGEVPIKIDRVVSIPRGCTVRVQGSDIWKRDGGPFRIATNGSLADVTIDDGCSMSYSYVGGRSPPRLSLIAAATLAWDGVHACRETPDLAPDQPVTGPDVADVLSHVDRARQLDALEELRQTLDGMARTPPPEPACSVEAERGRRVPGPGLMRRLKRSRR